MGMGILAKKCRKMYLNLPVHLRAPNRKIPPWLDRSRPGDAKNLVFDKKHLFVDVFSLFSFFFFFWGGGGGGGGGVGSAIELFIYLFVWSRTNK